MAQNLANATKQPWKPLRISPEKKRRRDEVVSFLHNISSNAWIKKCTIVCFNRQSDKWYNLARGERVAYFREKKLASLIKIACFEVRG